MRWESLSRCPVRTRVNISAGRSGWWRGGGVTEGRSWQSVFRRIVWHMTSRCLINTYSGQSLTSCIFLHRSGTFALQLQTTDGHSCWASHDDTWHLVDGAWRAGHARSRDSQSRALFLHIKTKQTKKPLFFFFIVCVLFVFVCPQGIPGKNWKQKNKTLAYKYCRGTTKKLEQYCTHECS